MINRNKMIIVTNHSFTFGTQELLPDSEARFLQMFELTKKTDGTLFFKSIIAEQNFNINIIHSPKGKAMQALNRYAEDSDMHQLLNDFVQGEIKAEKKRAFIFTEKGKYSDELFLNIEEENYDGPPRFYKK